MSNEKNATRKQINVRSNEKMDFQRYWYTDDDINNLLNIYIGGDKKIEYLDAMLASDEKDRNVLRENLIQFNLNRFRAFAKQGVNSSEKDKVIVPINLNGNHWALLYMIYDRDGSVLPSIYYFDPLGNRLPTALKNTLRNVTLFPNVNVIPISGRVQADTFNCGPWIIKAAVAIAKNQGIPERGYDINADRNAQLNLLFPNNPSVATEEKREKGKERHILPNGNPEKRQVRTPMIKFSEKETPDWVFARSHVLALPGPSMTVTAEDMAVLTREFYTYLVKHPTTSEYFTTGLIILSAMAGGACAAGTAFLGSALCAGAAVLPPLAHAKALDYFKNKLKTDNNLKTTLDNWNRPDKSPLSKIHDYPHTIKVIGNTFKDHPAARIGAGNALLLDTITSNPGITAGELRGLLNNHKVHTLKIDSHTELDFRPLSAKADAYHQMLNKYNANEMPDTVDGNPYESPYLVTSNSKGQPINLEVLNNVFPSDESIESHAYQISITKETVYRGMSPEGQNLIDQDPETRRLINDAIAVREGLNFIGVALQVFGHSKRAQQAGILISQGIPAAIKFAFNLASFIAAPNPESLAGMFQSGAQILQVIGLMKPQKSAIQQGVEMIMKRLDLLADMITQQHKALADEIQAYAEGLAKEIADYGTLISDELVQVLKNQQKIYTDMNEGLLVISEQMAKFEQITLQMFHKMDRFLVAFREENWDQFQAEGQQSISKVRSKIDTGKWDLKLSFEEYSALSETLLFWAIEGVTSAANNGPGRVTLDTAEEILTQLSRTDASKDQPIEFGVHFAYLLKAAQLLGFESTNPKKPVNITLWYEICRLILLLETRTPVEVIETALCHGQLECSKSEKTRLEFLQEKRSDLFEAAIKQGESIQKDEDELAQSKPFWETLFQTVQDISAEFLEQVTQTEKEKMREIVKIDSIYPSQLAALDKANNASYALKPFPNVYNQTIAFNFTGVMGTSSNIPYTYAFSTNGTSSMSRGYRLASFSDHANDFNNSCTNACIGKEFLFQYYSKESEICNHDGDLTSSWVYHGTTPLPIIKNDTMENYQPARELHIWGTNFAKSMDSLQYTNITFNYFSDFSISPLHLIPIFVANTTSRLAMHNGILLPMLPVAYNVTFDPIAPAAKHADGILGGTDADFDTQTASLKVYFKVNPKFSECFPNGTQQILLSDQTLSTYNLDEDVRALKACEPISKDRPTLSGYAWPVPYCVWYDVFKSNNVTVIRESLPSNRITPFMQQNIQHVFEDAFACYRNRTNPEVRKAVFKEMTDGKSNLYNIYHWLQAFITLLQNYVFVVFNYAFIQDETFQNLTINLQKLVNSVQLGKILTAANNTVLANDTSIVSYFRQELMNITLLETSVMRLVNNTVVDPDLIERKTSNSTALAEQPLNRTQTGYLQAERIQDFLIANRANLINYYSGKLLAEAEKSDEYIDTLNIGDNKITIGDFAVSMRLKAALEGSTHGISREQLMKANKVTPVMYVILKATTNFTLSYSGTEFMLTHVKLKTAGPKQVYQQIVALRPWSDQSSIAGYLKGVGIDINLTDGAGRTVLYHAIKHCESTELLDDLLVIGANPAVITREGDGLLDLALDCLDQQRGNYIIKWLLANQVMGCRSENVNVVVERALQMNPKKSASAFHTGFCNFVALYRAELVDSGFTIDSSEDCFGLSPDGEPSSANQLTSTMTSLAVSAAITLPTMLRMPNPWQYIKIETEPSGASNESASSPYDGRWDRSPVFDQEHQFLAFIYRVFDKKTGAELGRMKFLGQPELCEIAGRHNVVEKTGILKDVEVDLRDPEFNYICQSLPPTYFKELGRHCFDAAKHGTFRGMSNVSTELLMRRGMSASKAWWSSQLLVKYPMIFLAELYRANAKLDDASLHEDEANYKVLVEAATNTATIFAFQMGLMAAKPVLQVSARLLQTLQFSSASKLVNMVADKLDYLVYGWRGATYGYEALSRTVLPSAVRVVGDAGQFVASVATGIVVETAVTKVGQKATKQFFDRRQKALMSKADTKKVDPPREEETNEERDDYEMMYLSPPTCTLF